MKHLFIVPALFFSMVTSALTELNSSIDKKPVCPICKTSDNVIPIVYGKPAKELMDKAERGEVKLGGCVIEEKSPHNHCKKDNKDF
jgi:hypothetical protein